MKKPPFTPRNMESPRSLDSQKGFSELEKNIFLLVLLATLVSCDTTKNAFLGAIGMESDVIHSVRPSDFNDL